MLRSPMRRTVLMSVTLALCAMACGPDAEPSPPPTSSPSAPRPASESVADPGFIDEIIHEGSRRARAEAAATLHAVRAAMRLDYFGL